MSANIHFLSKAGRNAAHKSTFKYQVGAVIFKKSKIIGVGHNKTKTHPKLSSIFKYGTVHAEVDACFNVENEENLIGSSIFVYRENVRGGPAMARPCAMCVQVLYQMGVKKAYWTINDFPYWDFANISDMYKSIDRRRAYETNCRKI